MDDGKIDIREQVRLMRAVIGRKYMEIDDLDEKAAQLTGDEAGKCLEMTEFLQKDIAGYKTIIEDLKDDTKDLTGNLWDIASLPENSAELYNDYYLPKLSDQDREDEIAAMDLKSEYAVDLAKMHITQIGRVALTDPMVIDLMIANPDVSAAIGNIILEYPELVNAMKTTPEQ
jgi:hypothetical protein